MGLKDLTVAEIEGRLREMAATTFDGVFVWRISDFTKKRQDAIAGRAPAMFSPGNPDKTLCSFWIKGVISCDFSLCFRLFNDVCIHALRLLCYKNLSLSHGEYSHPSRTQYRIIMGKKA